MKSKIQGNTNTGKTFRLDVLLVTALDTPTCIAVVLPLLLLAAILLILISKMSFRRRCAVIAQEIVMRLDKPGEEND
jgi:hypothetical protein